MPPIGIIDFYGLRTIAETQVRQALQIQEGDAVPGSEEAWHRVEKEAQQRLEALPGVALARLTLVCCDAGKTIVYVGVEEKGGPSRHFRAAPEGKVRLPDDVVEAGKAFEKAHMEAVLKGDATEEDSQGHALMHNPAARAVQERFVTFAARDLKVLRDVLHNSPDADQRTLAAQVLAYTADKRAVVPDLVEAMQDPDSGVRNNAMRALSVMAEYAQKHPELHIQIPAEPFIEMLNSIVWTDRNKASAALSGLTVKRDPAILSDLREHALPSLIEMARWKSPGHAGAAYFILGRLGGLSEKEIGSAWDHGDREAVISAALKSAQAY